MRAQLLLALSLAAAAQVPGQTAATTLAPLPKDSRELLAMAAPLYDFNSPALKPWHLKATYQVYDRNVKPTEQGTYEYWWASPNVYRSTWTSPNGTHTDWYTAGGKHMSQTAGGRLNFFAKDLQRALFSPLPTAFDLDPARIRLDLEDLTSGNAKFPCIWVMPLQAPPENLPHRTPPTYCFDPIVPALRSSSTFWGGTTQFNKIGKVQGRFLPQEIVVSLPEQKVLSATADSANGLSPTDPVFTPPPDATPVTTEKLEVGATITAGALLKKVKPDYPVSAKALGLQGTVVLLATIGEDGKTHDLFVIQSPSDSLAAAAIEAVSDWEYKPYLFNGKPVEVETTINVIFTLGR